MEEAKGGEGKEKETSQSNYDYFVLVMGYEVKTSCENHGDIQRLLPNGKSVFTLVHDYYTMQDKYILCLVIIH